jgi:hypothetical protein
LVAIRCIKNQAPTGEAIHVRGLNDRVAVGTQQGLQIINEDKKDVWFGISLASGAG